MAENFYTILTKVGKAKLANSQVTGVKVDLSEMVVGDSSGVYYNPTETQTSLKHEVWRGGIGSIAIDEQNPNWIVIETVIPADVGGFNVREVGILDAAGDLIAIGKYPDTYKPVLSQGSAKDLYIRMIIEVTNASNVTLKIDPTVVIASRKYVDDKLAQVVGTVGGTIDKVKDGSLTIPSLETNNKELAGSINELKNYAEMSKQELQQELQNLQQKLGELDGLDSTEKGNLVSAINEVIGLLAAHLADEVKHLKVGERAKWDAKETPEGAQAKADKAEQNAKEYTKQQNADNEYYLMVQMIP